MFGVSYCHKEERLSFYMKIMISSFFLQSTNTQNKKSSTTVKHKQTYGHSINWTRMHSSRMRTGRSLTVCWRLLPGGVPGPGGWGGVGVWSRGGGAWSWGVCSRGVPCRGGLLPGGGGLVSQHALRQNPPCGKTHACKNITLAQLRSGR